MKKKIIIITILITLIVASLSGCFNSKKSSEKEFFSLYIEQNLQNNWNESVEMVVETSFQHYYGYSADSLEPGANHSGHEWTNTSIKGDIYYYTVAIYDDDNPKVVDSEGVAIKEYAKQIKEFNWTVIPEEDRIKIIISVDENGDMNIEKQSITMD